MTFLPSQHFGVCDIRWGDKRYRRIAIAPTERLCVSLCDVAVVVRRLAVRIWSRTCGGAGLRFGW